MPLFSPVVGNYYRGMLLEIPLFFSQLRKGSSLETLHELFSERYADEPFIDILPLNSTCMLDDGFLSPTHCNNTNKLQLMLFGHEQHVLLIARYDNLGKGAAGAAIQNLNLMTGSDETAGLRT
jgi:N-acetyl-gamma-glutamyl-phosphate reductase